MKRRTVQVNLLLLGLAVLWVYLLADNWGMAEGEGRLDSPGPEAATAASSRPASRASASDAGAIAGHHLFHSDRHNDLPEEALEEPEEQRRPAPVLMGTMGLGGEDVALMVSGGSRSSGGLYRRLKVGEELDGYTLVRIEADRVVMKTGEQGDQGRHARSIQETEEDGPDSQLGPYRQPFPFRPASNDRCRFRGRRQAAAGPVAIQSESAVRNPESSVGNGQGRQAPG